MTRMYVLGLAFSQDFSRVVMIRKNRPEWQRGFMNGVGGHVEDSDPGLIHAMSREFKEETSVDINHMRWLNFLEFGNAEWKVWCFTTTLSEQELQSVMTTTDEEVMVVSMTNIHDIATIPNIRWMVPLAIDFFRENKYTMVNYA